VFQSPEQAPAADDTQARAAALIQAVEDACRPAAIVPTSYRDTSPVPAVGTAAPVAQPGRPPMSQRATDASVLMLTAGAASVPVGGSVSLVLWTLGHIDPVVLAVAGAAPVALLTALARVIGRAKAAAEAAPATHHHHYAGPVNQDHSRITTTTTTTTRGVIAHTTANNGG
jgi:hypothetical protein